MNEQRLERLTQQMRSNGLEAIAVVPGPNLYYLSGLRFHLSERPTVAFFRARDRPLFVVPHLEAGKARQAPYPVEVLDWTDSDGPRETFQTALDRLMEGMASQMEAVRLGVEGRRCRYLELQLFGNLGISNTDGLFDRLRMTKDPAELEAMDRAASIAEMAFEATLPFIEPGVTEKAVAAELVTQLLRAGSEPELPFFPLVASGPNGADPHLFPTDRKLEQGDMMVIDWGATCDGYMSDITRCVSLGRPDPELLKVHDIVDAAAKAGREAARPGATGQDVDRAARKVIADAGYGERFIHRTGHGLGLEGHEGPYMNEGDLTELRPGMTFTVEPGVYLPGKGGVRIEDDMVITDDGARSMTGLDRGLRVLG